MEATYNPVTGILTTESYASGVNLKTTYNTHRSRDYGFGYARGVNLKATYNPVRGILLTESYASGINLKATYNLSDVRKSDFDYARGANLKATYNRFRNVLVTLALILAFVLGASRVFVLGVAV